MKVILSTAMKQKIHPCPCCGYQTYLEPTGGTMQICPVCFWEDAPGEFLYNRSNETNLFTAQENFTEFGATERKYLNLVREPLPAEVRRPDWLSGNQIKAKVAETIRAAFGDVLRDGGVSLHQADALDDYAEEAEFKAAERKDPEYRWQDISSDKISKFNGSLTFFDDKGFRFYLPAFMIFALDSFEPTHGSMDADGVLFATSDPHGFHKEHFAILNPSQMEAVAAFLKFAYLFNEIHFNKNDLRVFTNFWSQHLPDFMKP
jgi:hypothetical protein